MGVDSATRDFLNRMREAASKPRDQMTPAEARQGLSRLRQILGAGPTMHRIENVHMSTEQAEIPVRILIPTAGGCAGLMVYFHGGGWVVGGLDEFEPQCRSIAAHTGCAVAMVEYRKAPEHPFPAAVNDAWQSFNWIAARSDTITGRRAPLLVGGDSAGANLAITVTFRARDAGHPAIAGQVLIYPVTDGSMSAPSYGDPENQLMLNQAVMSWYWNHYAPDPWARSSPEASPALRRDLTGLPPAIVLTAEHDVLRDEGEAYAQRLYEAGVPVTQRRFAGQMHGFAMMVDVLPGSQAASEFIGEEVRALLQRSAPPAYRSN